MKNYIVEKEGNHEKILPWEIVRLQPKVVLTRIVFVRKEPVQVDQIARHIAKQAFDDGERFLANRL